MKRICIAAALSVLLSASTAQAYYTITSDFTAAVTNYSGQRDFFRNTAALDVESVRGSFRFTATRQQPQPYHPGDPTYDILYYGTASYNMALFDTAGNSLLSFGDSGTFGYLHVINYVKDATWSVRYVMDLNAGSYIGGNYAPASFSTSAFHTSPGSSFSLRFDNSSLGRSGFISGSLPSSSLAFSPQADYTPPPVPTPAPAGALLLGPGLALLSLLRKRHRP